MDQMSKTSVEPLSDAAWARIEAGLFARLDRGEHHAPADDEPLSASRGGEVVVPRRRPWRPWALSAAVAAAAALALWLHSGASGERAAREPLAGTAASAPSSVTAAPPVSGERAVSAQPAQTDSALSVRDISARDSVAPASSAVARVADGARVTTTTSGRQLLVGDSAVTLGEASGLSVAGDDARGFTLTLERGQIDCEITPRAGRPPFVVDAGDVTVTVIGTRFRVAREPAGTRVDVVHGIVRVSTPEANVRLGAGQSWPTPGAGAEPGQTPRRAPAPSTRPGHGDPAARFERAARLESSNPDLASRIYRELARGSGPWASNALYAAARLEIEHRHERRGRALLERYLARYPRGANAADARELLERR